MEGSAPQLRKQSEEDKDQDVERPDDLLDLAAVNSQAIEQPTHVLPYHHYSIVLNKERRLAFFSAVNIDGATHFREDLKRQSDRWFYDPRRLREEQTGEEVYASNPLDRGHLVRRLDPRLGATLEVAKPPRSGSQRPKRSCRRHRRSP